MIDEPEFGYTPENLKRLRKKYSITQQRMAELLDTNISTARRWETSIDRTSHATMPYVKWVEFISILQNQRQN
jgi:putative transcriptional regulator